MRIATRDDQDHIVGDVHGQAGVEWHYEGRWRRPTYVNADGAVSHALRVYRIPDRAHFEAEDPAEQPEEARAGG